MKYTYLKGSHCSQETVTFDIIKHSQYITTCVVDVHLLLCGIKTFPCGNGDDVELTAQQLLSILELVAEERRKITCSVEVKTMESWHASGLNFDDYCFPGDTVSEDLVNYLVNSVPPILLLSSCTQVGRAQSTVRDDKGKHRNTYATFHKTEDGNYLFDGYCFKGENQNREEKTYSQQQFEEYIAAVRKNVEACGGV